MQCKQKDDIIDFLSKFDAQGYWKSRNYIDGWVSQLSPYITHGIISTKECMQQILSRYTIKEAEKFLMELMRKEFFLQVQKNYGNEFLSLPVRDDKTWVTKKKLLATSLANHTTHTDRVNSIITQMTWVWWLHNHQRMWLASWCCHWAKLDWKLLADRTYYHFLDWELSANHLSRQWVNSTFANKAYMMNEENLQKYRPWMVDEDLRWTYEDVSSFLFDEDRESAYRKEEDVSFSFTTPLDTLDVFDSHLYEWKSAVRLLTPWRLDEDLLWDDVYTIVLLDETFTQSHPWSQQRIDFVRSYTEKYAVPFVIWSYQTSIDDLLSQWVDVSIDERRDPIYREVQKSFLWEPWVSCIPYPWIHTSHGDEPIMKFFKYRNSSKHFIKKLWQ